MQIIDGYCNEPNIYADDIGEYNVALWGSGDYVLPAGEQLGYELVSNNEVKIKDGIFVTQGRRGVIKKGTTESCTIENGTQAENRNDLIVIEYAKDPFTLVESHTLKVIQGTPGESAVDPDVVTGDIQAGDVLHQMPLYRVKLEGLNVVAVERMFTVGSIAPETTDPMSASEAGLAADAKLTGDAFRSMSANLTNENNETFVYGCKNGVRGFYTNPSRADDSFIPFNSIKEMTDKRKYYASQDSGNRVLTYEIPENKPGFLFLWEDYISTEANTSCCAVSGCTKVFTSGALYHMQYDEQKLSLFRFDGGETITINRRAGGTRDTLAGVYVCIIY